MTLIAVDSTMFGLNDRLTFRVRKSGMKIAVFVAVLLNSFAATADLPTSESEPDKAGSCEYTNFIAYRNHPEYKYGEGLASEEIMWEVEDIFARELELAGFHHTEDARTAWLFLRALLMPSTLKSDAVSGVVQLVASASLNRDLLYQLSDELAPLSRIEMIVPIEINVQPGGGGLGPTVAVQQFARRKARWIWAEIEPTLSALCAWRTELIDDGLTIEDLQRELVDGMVRIQHEYRERKRGGSQGIDTDP